MVFVMPVKKLSVGVCMFAFWYLSIGWTTLANAHPHMWVDLKSQIVLHDDGGPSAINQEWLFDDFFSTALIEEASFHPDGIEASCVVFARAERDCGQELRIAHQQASWPFWTL